MSAQYLAPRTTRALIRAGFDVIGTAAIRNGVCIARRDGQWIVARKGDASKAVKCLTIADALNAADHLAYGEPDPTIARRQRMGE